MQNGGSTMDEGKMQFAKHISPGVNKDGLLGRVLEGGEFHGPDLFLKTIRQIKGIIKMVLLLKIIEGRTQLWGVITASG